MFVKIEVKRFTKSVFMACVGLFYFRLSNFLLNIFESELKRFLKYLTLKIKREGTPIFAYPSFMIIIPLAFLLLPIYFLHHACNEVLNAKRLQPFKNISPMLPMINFPSHAIFSTHFVMFRDFSSNPTGRDHVAGEWQKIYNFFRMFSLQVFIKMQFKNCCGIFSFAFAFTTFSSCAIVHT